MKLVSAASAWLHWNALTSQEDCTAARSACLLHCIQFCWCAVLQASSAYKHSLKEVLALPAIAGKIKDTKAAREVSALQDFYAMLTADSSRAFYGPGHVLAAAELGAIQTLLISGALGLLLGTAYIAQQTLIAAYTVNCGHSSDRT